MTKIGILSDTHSFLSDEIFEFFADVDQIWHAGDIGSLEIIDKLNKFKPTIAVYGNIDDYTIKTVIKEKILYFTVENTKVLLTHIAGRPGKYSKEILDFIKTNPINILVCGHSHILTVKYDKTHNFLYVNPGAFGNYGFHNVRTALKLTINHDKFENLKILELKR